MMMMGKEVFAIYSDSSESQGTRSLELAPTWHLANTVLLFHGSITFRKKEKEEKSNFKKLTITQNG